MDIETEEVGEIASRNSAIRVSISKLQWLVECLIRSKISNKEEFRSYIKEPANEEFLERTFGFDKLPPNSDRPKVNSLFSANFHPDYPLVIFNYNQNAHHKLHAMTESWTWPLRLCRGIVFDLESSDLLALPLEKFFNYGDHPESSNLRFIQTLPYLELEKHDGHLGIIFHYRDKLLITTRGNFASPTSKLATEMLKQYGFLVNWKERLPQNTTMLVEIIDEKTRIIRDYGMEHKFVLIGCRRDPLLHSGPIDYSYEELGLLGASLGLEVVEGKYKRDLRETIHEVARRDVDNREGYVVILEDGRRVKFKYVNYIGEMVRRELSYSYLMNQAVNGRLEKMLDTLDEEIRPKALEMLGQISLIMFAPGDAKSKWRRLYKLLPKDKQTTSFKDACRRFAKKFTINSEQIIGGRE